jgi:hypothetical protein
VSSKLDASEFGFVREFLESDQLPRHHAWIVKAQLMKGGKKGTGNNVISAKSDY